VAGISSRPAYAYLRDVTVTNLVNTLLLLATEQNSPGNPSRVLTLQEERFRLSVHEAENLRVTTYKELSLGGVDLAT